jgi:hypothetical protein
MGFGALREEIRYTTIGVERGRQETKGGERERKGETGEERVRNKGEKGSKVLYRNGYNV